MKQSSKLMRALPGTALVVTMLGAASIAFAQDATPVPQTPETAQAQTQEQPYLGILLQRSQDGVVVQDVLADSPAEAAGLQAGDVITAVNGEAVAAPRQLVRIIASLNVGDNVSLTITRDGEEQNLDVILAALPASLMQQTERPFNQTIPFGQGYNGGGRGQFGMPLGGAIFQMFGTNGRLGVAYEPVDAQVAEENSLSVTEGALVLEVAAGSPAETAGLQTGDVIIAVNGDAVDEEHTLRDRLIAYEPGDTITLSVIRDGETIELEATLAKPEMGANMIFPFIGGMQGFPGMEGGFNFQMPPLPEMPEMPEAQPLPQGAGV